jgi:hypothetical protein
LILNHTVSYKPTVQGSENKNQSIFGIDKMDMLFAASISAALIVLLVFLLRMRRRRKDKLSRDAGNSTTGKEDISLLDDDGVDSA